MKQNQHKTKHQRTTYERVNGNPMFGMGDTFIAVSVMSAKDYHESMMPQYTKLNKKGRF